MFRFFKNKGTGVGTEWYDRIHQPIETIADRMNYYTGGKSDLAIFQNGTCVLLKDGLSDEDAEKSAKEVLGQIGRQHPDFNHVDMDDGNILVSYNYPARNVVLSEVIHKHWKAIDKNLGLKKGDGTPIKNDSLKKALFGRNCLFMDIKNPKLIKIVRKTYL